MQSIRAPDLIDATRIDTEKSITATNFVKDAPKITKYTVRRAKLRAREFNLHVLGAGSICANVYMGRRGREAICCASRQKFVN